MVLKSYQFHMLKLNLDFTSAKSCIVDNRDLNFGEMLPIVK